MSEVPAVSVFVGDTRIEVLLVGGSAGALDVLRDILGGLPADLRIPVVVVVHVAPQSPALLHEVLQPVSPLPMKQAEDKEPLAAGTIYFAPPGYHLLIETHRAFALSIDEPVNFSRPSIDVLFESAASAFDRGLMAVLLSGASIDGAQGLQAVDEVGGVIVVQRPDTAEAAAMPEAAIAQCPSTRRLSPCQIRELFASLKPRPSASPCP